MIIIPGKSLSEHLKSFFLIRARKNLGGSKRSAHIREIVYRGFYILSDGCPIKITQHKVTKLIKQDISEVNIAMQNFPFVQFLHSNYSFCYDHSGSNCILFHSAFEVTTGCKVYIDSYELMAKHNHHTRRYERNKKWNKFTHDIKQEFSHAKCVMKTSSAFQFSHLHQYLAVEKGILYIINACELKMK